MEFRKASVADVGSIMDIIRQAQEYLRKQGIDQWQNNYPCEATILEDISKEYGYVLTDGDEVIGTVAVIFDGDKNYNIIDGRWLTDGPYTVIHRIAVLDTSKGKGLASVMLAHIDELSLKRGFYSLRVDTHEKNISMQKLLHKNGFAYCGIIYLEDGAKRVAFEKALSNSRI